MKFTTSTLALQKALIPFNELEFPRSGTDRNSLIKMELHSGMLTLSMCINNKISMKSELQVNDCEDGSLVISYINLWANINILESENISFELKENSILTISSDDRVVEIRTVSDDLNIETIDVENKTAAFELSGKDFVRLIRQTIRCVSEDLNRPFLNGVNFSKTEDKLEAASTTGFIVAVSSIPVATEFEPFSIRKESLYICQKYISNEASVKVYADDDYSIISFDDICIKQELAPAPFPNVKRFFGSEYESKTVISKSAFCDVLKVFANITAEQDFPVMEISIDKNRFIMSCESLKTEIKCSEESDPYNGNFNIHYMMDIVSLLDTEELKLDYINDNSTALKIKINNSDFFEALIMPRNR